MNPYLDGNIVVQGLHQLAYTNLWEIDTVKGTQYPAGPAGQGGGQRDAFMSANGTNAKCRLGLGMSDVWGIVLQNPVVFVGDCRPGVLGVGLSRFSRCGSCGIEASAALAKAPATPGKQLQTTVGHARAA
jgi:hypothetical protein